MRKVLIAVMVMLMISMTYVSYKVDARTVNMDLESVGNKLYLHIDQDRVLVDLYDSTMDYSLAVFNEYMVVRGQSDDHDEVSLNIVDEHHRVWHASELELNFIRSEKDLVVTDEKRRYICKDVFNSNPIAKMSINQLCNVDVKEDCLLLTYTLNESPKRLHIYLDSNIEISRVEVTNN